MSCVNYNLLKDGSLTNATTTVSGYLLLDAEAIAALYDGDLTTPAYTISGTPQRVHLRQEYGESFDICFVRYYTNEVSSSRIAMTYTTVEGNTVNLNITLESPGVYRANINAGINFFDLYHSVSGTVASAYELEIYGTKNESLGFGTATNQIDYYTARHSTAHMLSAEPNVIPLFNDSQYDDVVKISIAPTLTDADSFLFLGTSGTGPFYGINEYGFSQPGYNPITLHDDSFLSNTIDPQWVRRAPAQSHEIVPTEEGLYIDLAYNSDIGGTYSRRTSGIYSKEAFTSYSFTAEVQLRFTDVINTGVNNPGSREFFFLLTNNYPIPDIGYFDAYMTDRRRGCSVAGIVVDPHFPSSMTKEAAAYHLRWVDGSDTSNPSTGVGNTTDFRFYTDPTLLFSPTGEVDQSGDITFTDLEDIRNGGNDYGDFTDAAGWHTWRLVWDHKKKEISAYVDNIYLGSRVMKVEAFGEACRLYIGTAENGGVTFVVRNFKILPNKIYRQYLASSTTLGALASATVSGSEAYKINDGTTSKYVAPQPTSNTHVRIDFAEPTDVVYYRFKQLSGSSSTSAYGVTHHPDVARQALVDFGGVLLETHQYPNSSDYVVRAPTISNDYPVTVSGISYLDIQFTEYTRTSLSNGALILEELEVYASETIDVEPPGARDGRNIPWSEGRWNNLRQFGTSTGLAIKYRQSLNAAFYPYPEYFIQGVDYGVSSAVNGRQFADETNEYHFAGALFSSPGSTGAGDYRQWHSANQTDNHIYIWRSFPEVSRVRGVYWNSTTFNRSHVADKFKFQYLSENGDPNVEADWVNISPVSTPHPYTGGTFSADTNYKNYKAYLISNNDGVYYTNYYLLPAYGTGFTLASQGSLVSYPRGLAIPEGYFSSSIAVNLSASDPTANGLRGYVEFDREYNTRAIRMVVHSAKESGRTGTAGTPELSFALETFLPIRTNGAGSYTSPVFDTGTPQNTERLSTTIREFDGASSNIYVRSSDAPPTYSYNDTYEIWESLGSHPLGTVGTTDRFVSYNGTIYAIGESFVKYYDPALDLWGSFSSYPATGASTTDSVFGEPGEDDEAGDTASSNSTGVVPDDRVYNNCSLLGDILYVACRTTGDQRTPRLMFTDLSEEVPVWSLITENRAPLSENATMVGYAPENRLYFFNEDGTVLYYDIEESVWIVEDAIMPTFGSTREGSAVAMFEDVVYILGGEVAGNGTVNCTAFDMRSKTFSVLTSAPYRIGLSQAVLVGRFIYVIPVGGNGSTEYRPSLKYNIDGDSWEILESMMWYRDSGNLITPSPSSVFYHEDYIYRFIFQSGMSRAYVGTTSWTPGTFPALRDPLWGSQLGTAFPWVKLDSFGELMPQERYFQFRIELYSEDQTTSPILEDVTVVTPQSIPIPASGTASAYLKIGVSPDGLYEAWYSADRVGNSAAINGSLSAVEDDFSVLYTKSSSPTGWGIAATVSGAWDPPTDSSFSQRIAIHSPWVIKESANLYKMWVTNDHTNPSETFDLGCHIHYAELTSPATPRADTRVISEGVISQAAQGAMHPCVLKLSPTSYKIWYTGLDASNVPRILSASSSNGTVWTGHAVSLNVSTSVWDTAGASKPSVLLEGGVYKMWYTGEDSSGVKRILYTTSNDGNTWTAPRVVIDAASEGALDIEGSYNAFVLKDDIEYACWYIGNDGTYNTVIYANSPDGLEWFNFQIAVPPGGLVDYIDGEGAVDFFVVLNKDVVVPGSMVTGAQLRLYNDGAAL